MADEKKEKKQKKGKGEGGGATAGFKPSGASTTQAVSPRLAGKYAKDVTAVLTKQFGYKNPMQVPRLEKIVINMGLGAAVTNPKIVDSAVDELRALTGQKPIITRSRKAIASFKLRAGLPIGAMVTLRKGRMWEFFDRLVSLALPRTRDFRGVSRKAFDGKGNYSLGLKEQIIFPEIDYDRIDVIKGMNISFVTTAHTDEEGRALLQHLGMPFRQA
ncbi:MAG: 50S ribosomal protein L5 [Polyangiaceae bacterium]|nr:50S ribosomal protein L5 [Polyangiaceae bacterium]